MMESKRAVNESDTEALLNLAKFLQHETTFVEKPKSAPKLYNGTALEATSWQVEKWPEPKVKLDKPFNVGTPQIHIENGLRPVLGGTPITAELAYELRMVLLGSAIHSFSSDWRKLGLLFHPASTTPFPYGLQVKKNCARGIVMSLQAHIIKHLSFKQDIGNELFENKTKLKLFRMLRCHTFHGEIDLIKNKHWEESVLEPSSSGRRDALVKSVCEILWRAGEKKYACVCLPQEIDHVGPSNVYRTDGITEKLVLFHFEVFEELFMFLKRNINYFEFESTNGCILFLYSVVLSRRVDRILEDLGTLDIKEYSLLGNIEECTIVLVNLLLTGKAVKYLHNGDVVYDSREKLLEKPLLGIKERSDIGILYWNKEEDDRNRTSVGSMLKTPKYPIWLTVINDQFGLLFSTNLDLLADWKKEHYFHLHYYTGVPSQTEACRLTIDTRNRHSVIKSAYKRYSEPEKKIPALEECIFTKWYGSSVNWNGTMPFV